MPPNLGTTQYYQYNTNGNPSVQSMAWGGNTPYGATSITQDQYKTFLTNALNTGYADPNNSQSKLNPDEVNRYSTDLQAVQNQTGVHAPGYVDPQFAKFNPQGQPTQANETPAAKAADANIPVNLGGTGAFKAAPNLGGASSPNLSYTSTPLPPATQVGNGVPNANVGTPALPSQSSTGITDSYYQSLANQVSNLQTQLDTQRQQQLDQINQQKQTAQASLDNANSNEQGAIADEQKAKLDQVSLEEQRFNDNYNTVQGLASQLTDLMTKGNDLIAQEKGVTGLASIRDPRIAQTVSSITAATGVIQAAISTYSGQMSAARDQLNTATSAITSAYSDQINYYDSIRQFYQTGVVTATAAQNKFVDDTITLLKDKLKTAEDNSQALQNEFLDPTKALAFAQAGITINTPQSQWGPLLEKQAYSEELTTQNKDMADKGYTKLINGNAPSGASIVTQLDSHGVTQTYYKAPDFTLGKDVNGNPISINKTTGLISSVIGGGGNTNPTPTSSSNQYTVTKDDVNGYDSIAPKMGTTAQALRDANPGLNERNLQIGQKINLTAPTPYKAIYGNTKVQDQMEKDLRTQVSNKEFMGRSNGYVVNDLKVSQANKAAALFNQMYDPATGNYNITQSQYGELATSLAALLGGSNGATDNQREDIKTATAKGDINKAYTYFTGNTANGSTQDVLKLLASSIDREAQQAVQDRNNEGNKLISVNASSDLDPARLKKVQDSVDSSSLNYIGINGLASSHQGFSLPGSTPTYNGFTLPH